ncbi:MAG TPA: universal stress protein [Bacteroidales bacterium]|nr:universal stress protein [Bacteroidales bacterium]
METVKKQKVLIALDYDLTAKKVAEKGYLMAQSMGAEVMLLHVIADSTYYSSLEYSPIVGFLGVTDFDSSNLIDSGGLKKLTMHFLDNMKHHLKDDTIRTLIKEGDFAEAILETAKEIHADIIVMGTHSRKWLENIVMGSVTEKVLNHTAIPLFIIPTRKPH